MKKYDKLLLAICFSSLAFSFVTNAMDGKEMPCVNEEKTDNKGVKRKRVEEEEALKEEKERGEQPEQEVAPKVKRDFRKFCERASLLFHHKELGTACNFSVVKFCCASEEVISKINNADLGVTKNFVEKLVESSIHENLRITLIRPHELNANALRNAQAPSIELNGDFLSKWLEVDLLWFMFKEDGWYFVETKTSNPSELHSRRTSIIPSPNDFKAVPSDYEFYDVKELPAKLESSKVIVLPKVSKFVSSSQNWTYFTYKE